MVEDAPLLRNFDEARNNSNWKRAMEDELKSLNKHDVWDICECLKNVKTVKSKWVFSTKRGEDNKVKYKARLVAAVSIK